ncbi:MAG TPA: serine/threonine-protein kinase, partial [Pirellulaceae bacterium]|nr:serine/threonine-protein kinase [Pirellulaceae bacterium]
MLQPEFSCRLGIFAWESDLIDAEQLALAFKTWVVNPTVPLVELMVEEGSLTSEDVQLLRTLWTEQTREINQDQTQDGSRDHVDSSGSSVMQVAEMGAEGFQANHRFEIIAELASGGLGKVSIAMDKTLKRKVAIKEMLSSHAHHPEARIRFTREAELTGQLEHPSIVPIHHLGVSAGDVPFYSMRLIEGKTLRELAKELKESMPGEIRFRSREFRRLLTSFITVCQAVEHAHSRKIVHRDIKPSNIVVGDHGETLLVDWGLAKAFKIRELAEEQTEICGVEETQRSRIEPGESDLDDFSVDLTAAGVAAGTAAYMSPEQTADAANAGPSSDIFSLGATLYYLLTGQAPYGGREYGEILAAARAGQYAFPRKVCSAVPLPLEAICQKAMAFSPKDRYPTAASLAEDIELWLADEPISICRDPLATRLRRWFVRHRAWSTAIAVSILAGLIGAAIFSSLTAYNHQLLKVAHDREQTARQIADHQGELALQTLKSVAWKIQQELQHIPAAQRVRRSLLEHLLDGLESVSIHLAQPREADMYAVRVHRDLGDMFLQIGNFGDRQGIALARRELRTALAKAEALSAQNPDDVEALRQLAITLQHLADLESRYGSTATALEMRWTALRSLEDLHRRAPDNEQVIRSRYVAHNLLGDLYVQLGQYADAGSHYLEALQIIDAQAGRGVQLPELKRDFVVSLNKVAGHYSRKGDPRLAEELYRRSLVATQALVEEHPDDFKYLRDLSTVHYQLGKICLAVGNFREAVEHHQRSQELDARRFDLDPANA